MHVPLASAWCRQRSSIVGKYVFPSSGQYPTGPTEGAVTYVFHPQWQILEKVELQGCVIWLLVAFQNILLHRCRYSPVRPADGKGDVWAHVS